MDDSHLSDKRLQTNDDSQKPPLSPRTVAKRVKKIVDSDTTPRVLPEKQRTSLGGSQPPPTSVVQDSLGTHSSSHPGLSFTEGGGFLVSTEVRRNLTESEARDDLEARTSTWKHHGSKGKAPEPSSQTLVFQGDIEYHPPGGIHSNYNTTSQEGPYGSYLRVKTSFPRKTETRIGRYGSFENDETFDKQKLDKKALRKTDKVAKELTQQPRSSSPPPSPRTARKLTDQLYRNPGRLLSELSTGDSYSTISHRLDPPPIFVSPFISDNNNIPDPFSTHVPTSSTTYTPQGIFHVPTPTLSLNHAPITEPTRPSWLPPSGSNQLVKLFDINRKK